MAYTIENGFVAPERTGRRGKPEKYPFSQLENGQKFFVPDTDTPSGNAASTLQNAAASRQSSLRKATGNPNLVFIVHPSTVDGVTGATIGRKDNA